MRKDCSEASRELTIDGRNVMVSLASPSVEQVPGWRVSDRGGRCRGTTPKRGEGIVPGSARWGRDIEYFFSSIIKPEIIGRFAYGTGNGLSRLSLRHQRKYVSGSNARCRF